MEKILLVDENPTTREVLNTYLRDIFQIKTAAVSHSIASAKDFLPHAIVFSIEKLFPLKQIMSEIRRDESLYDTAVLVFISDANHMTLESLYEWGVDDYLMRPVDFTQLFWKLKTLIRSRQVAGAEHVELGSLLLTPEALEVQKVSGDVIHVSKIQMKLLLAFHEHYDRLMTRDWLKSNVWSGEAISNRSIDAQISKLKALLPEISDHVISVYGRGYMWKSHPQRKAL